MSTQFKPTQGEDSYDLAAETERDCIKTRKYIYAKDWNRSMKKLDKEWAEQGEP